MASRDPEELVSRASLGDALAVDELLDRHLPDLRRYVEEEMGSGLRALETADDVVQSVCRELLEGLSGFEYRGERAFGAWLRRAALRKLIDRRRHHRTLKRGGGAAALSAADLALLVSAIQSPSQEVSLREELEALGRGFAQLSLDDQEVVRLVHLEGLGHAEVAQRLGCSVESSRKQLSRALARLSRLVE